MVCKGILSFIQNNMQFLETKEIQRFEFKSTIPTPTQGHHFILQNGSVDYKTGSFKDIEPINGDYVFIIASEPPLMSLSILPVDVDFSVVKLNEKDNLKTTFSALYPANKITMTMMLK